MLNQLGLHVETSSGITGQSALCSLSTLPTQIARRYLRDSDYVPSHFDTFKFTATRTSASDLSTPSEIW